MNGPSGEKKQESISRAKAYENGNLEFKYLHPVDLLYVRKNGKRILKIERARRILFAVVLAGASDYDIEDRTIIDIYEEYKKKGKTI